MANSTRGNGGEAARRGVSSPRLKGRENAKDTLCRNVSIYGHCRYEDKGCAFNHDATKVGPEGKKRLNVDSPTFTPSVTAPATATNGPQAKPTTFSPKAAATAAPFTPKTSGMGKNTPGPQPTPPAQTPAQEWAVGEVEEFVPHNFEMMNDGFEYSKDAQMNPYAESELGMTQGMNSYYPAHNYETNYAQPLQYHLYAPVGPHRENLTPYQRTVHDLFIPDALREEMQRKLEASLQVLPNSNLPAHIDHFHTLVPLDTSNQKNTSLFGHSSWVYKTVSSKDGKHYALRRLEGFRLTNEKCIRSVQVWKRVSNANVVSVHDAFTTGAFGDRSLVFVTDYHPLSKTLYEHHFGSSRRAGAGGVTETTLWSYIVQIASALKSIHSHGLAARLMDATKILVTSKNRIRLNACAILDVVQFDHPGLAGTSVADLQLEDLVGFGKLIVHLGGNAPHLPLAKAMEVFGRTYSTELKDCVFWLLGSTTSIGSPGKTIDQFLQGISGQVVSAFNSSLHLDDTLHAETARELENARLVRLMAKFGFINERPEFEHDRQWSETGDRYFLKLFRDYVFHQVDAQGQPVIDLAHVLTCLAKVDAGVDEKVTLVSRDEQNVLVVSYRELKRGVESAFQDLVRAGSRSLKH